jgi:glycosyltransferase involved in cell wall biosynthesis
MDYIFITMSLWNEPKRARHHYVDAIIKESSNNRVFWVNRPYLHTDSHISQGIEKIGNQLFIFHLGLSILPKFLPRTLDEIFNIDFFKKRKLLFLFLDSLNVTKCVIVCFDYKGRRILNSFQPTNFKIYFCNDFFGFLPKILYQKSIARCVDAVVATDPRLVTYFERFNEKVLFLPHGLWYSDKIYYKKNKVLKKIVYSGTLNSSIDYSFLNFILIDLNIELHLIGPIIEIDKKSKILLDSLLTNSKVIYHGHVSDLALRNSLIEDCDICLLPYLEEFNGFVLKYFDYLNLGKPILSTKFNTFWIPEYKKYVYFWDYNYNAEDNFNNVFSSYSEDVFEEMRSLAFKSSWEIRLNSLNNFIKKCNFE